jgi:hypothetical protein
MVCVTSEYCDEYIDTNGAVRVCCAVRQHFGKKILERIIIDKYIETKYYL